MKKLHLVSFIFISFVSCNSNDKQPSTATVPPPVDSPKKEIAVAELAYPVKHFDWEIGDFNNAKKIIGMYKIWDEKKSFVTGDFFADTFRLHIPEVNREIVILNKDINKKLEENREMYHSASNDILSAVSLRDKASGEDWVMVTTYSKWTEMDGKKDSILYHDDWRLINGKVDLLLSFYKIPPKGFKKKTAAK